MAISSLFPLLLLSLMSVSTLAQETESRAWTDQQRTVLVHMELLDLVSINSVEQSFTANFYYELKWQDDSLKHDGPGSRRLSLDEIWNPQVQILNQQSIQKTLGLRVEVFPDGSIIYRQRVWGTFSQPLKLKKFPFDQQTIAIKMVPTGFAPEDIHLIIDVSSDVPSELTIPDWSLMDWNTASEDMVFGQEKNRLSQAALEINLKRDAGFFMAKILLPLALIVFMSWTIFWISPIDVGPQISVSVTAMLTLVAFRFSMTSMLPRLSLLTQLDWFLLYLTLLVFFSLLESVYTTHLAGAGQLEKALRIDRFSRWLFPALFLLALVDSFFLTD
jgi:hypothetical protein